MLPNIVSGLKNFRENIYNFFEYRQDAAMELVDALSSNTTAKSVVELSLNPLHRRNYCSITRVLDELIAETEKEKKQKRRSLTKLLSEHCISDKKAKYQVFGVDCTPQPRLFSPTLEDRSFVHAANTIIGNKPITIGHQYSIAAYLPQKVENPAPPWIVPLSCQRVATDQKGVMIGMQQINECIQSQEWLRDSLCVSVGDSAYSHPNCLSEASKNENQIHITRARNNRTFYYPIEETDGLNQRGRPKKYGKKYVLKDETTRRAADETVEFEELSKKGIIHRVKIDGWDSLIMRGNQDANVSDCHFRLLRVQVYKSSTGDALLFKRPLWLIVSGKRKAEISLQDIFNIYRQRFDLEHFFRFGKNRLLMDKTQTSDVEHEEAWWQLTTIAYAQLYLSREIAINAFKPWEKYLPSFRMDRSEKSPTQVQKDFGRIIQEIGTPAKAPKPRKKSAGRRLGQKQVKRQRHPIIKKQKTMRLLA